MKNFILSFTVVSIWFLFQNCLYAKTPYEIKKEMRAIKKPLKLYEFLVSGDLLNPNQLREGSADNIDENFLKEVGLLPSNLNIDIFKKNLFGAGSPELTMQIRFKGNGELQLDIYSVTFYFSSRGKWLKVPGNITVSQADSYNQSCRETKCPGYFCFSYQQLRKSGEYALIGKEYGGSCQGVGRGHTIDTTIWQITPKKVISLFTIRNEKYVYSSPVPYPTQQARSDLSFVESSNGIFPKQLKLVEYQYGFKLYTDELEECRDQDILDCNKYQTELIKKTTKLVHLNYR